MPWYDMVSKPSASQDPANFESGSSSTFHKNVFVYDCPEVPMIFNKSPSRGRILAAAALLSLFLVSCASFRANTLLLMQTSDREKAEILFSDGLERFNNDLLKDNDLTQIGTVRSRFKDALKLDPDHPRANKYLVEVDAFERNQYALWLASAKSLSKRAKRNADQDYELVLAVKKLKDLGSIDKEVSRLSTETKDLRTRVIKDMETRVDTSDRTMMAEASEAVRLKNIKRTEYLAQSLQRIDAGNYIARRALKNASALREDMPLVASAPPSAPAADRKPAATPKPKTAAPVKSAVKPKASAKKKTKAHDYDVEIAVILTSVDARLNKNDPAGAREVISTYLPLLKKQANKNKLASKEGAVKTLAERLYLEGIDLYNQEDYEGARINFTAVARWNSKYEDVREYLDRSNAKIRALSGR